MSARRKQDIERALKNVQDALVQYDALYEKCKMATLPPHREKLSSDLRREMKRLQKLRDPVKGWAMEGGPMESMLLKWRRKIEVRMEEFRLYEKNMKNLSFGAQQCYNDLVVSSRGGGNPDDSEEEVDLDSHLNDSELSTVEWVQACLKSIGDMLEVLEEEREEIEGLKGRKRDAMKVRYEEIDGDAEEYQFHITNLKRALGLLRGGKLEADALDEIRGDIEYYVEQCIDDDFVNDEYVYEVLEMDEIEAAAAEEEEEEESSVEAPTPPPTAKPSTTPSSSSPAVPRGKKASSSAEPSPTAARSSTSTEKLAAKSVNSSTSVPVIATATIGGKKQTRSVAASVASSVAATPGSVTPPSSSPHRVTPAASAAAAAARNAAAMRSASSSSSVSVSGGAGGKISKQRVAGEGKSQPPSISSSAPPQRESVFVAHLHPPAFMAGKVITATKKPTGSKFGAPSAIKSMQAQARTGSQLSQMLEAFRSSHPPLSNGALSEGGISGAPGISAGSTNLHGGGSGAAALASLAAGGGSNGAAGGVAGGQLTPWGERIASAASFAIIDPQDDAEVRPATISPLDPATGLPVPIGSEKSPATGFAFPDSFPKRCPPVLWSSALYSRQLRRDGTLFFLFYYAPPNSPIHYYAARQLKCHSWRFHKKYLSWFMRQQRQDNMVKESDYEKGSYNYFAYQNWAFRSTRDFKFEYKFLEDLRL